MTGLLNDLMRDRADALGDPELDLDALMRDGQRRVVRRRTALAGGLVAATVLAAVAVPALLPGEPSRQIATTPPGAIDPVSYGEGSTIHSGDQTFDAGVQIASMVQTGGGWAVVDPAGHVRLVGPDSSVEVGRVADEVPDLTADGGLVAWIEAGQSQGDVLAVADQTGSSAVVRVPLDTSPGTERLGVVAVDGGTVYVHDDRGVVAIEVGDREARVVAAPAGSSIDVYDVEGGLIAYRDRAAVEVSPHGMFRVGRTLESGQQIGGRKVDLFNGDLSDDGRYVLNTYTDQEPAAIEVATNQAVQITHDYEALIPYRWVDDDHFLAGGLRDRNEPTADLLTCGLVTGDCALVARSPGTTTRLVVPN